MPPSIATFKLQWEIRKIDTDSSGFAHFSSYLKMMEETEYAFLRSRGLSVVLSDERGTLGFPRLMAELEVIKPLVFPDQTEIELNLTEIDGKQLNYQFDILNSNKELAVQGKFIAAICRFPRNALPYAILMPTWIENKLMGDDRRKVKNAK